MTASGVYMLAISRAVLGSLSHCASTVSTPAATCPGVRPTARRTDSDTCGAQCSNRGAAVSG
jgi:hypothetical protein